MNFLSNVGITELVLILLLALLVVGPERLPELAQQLGKTLRDVRKMYENLAGELGPELMSLQESTKDLRESVESVRSIPKDMVQQVVQAADLDGAMGELQGVKDSVDQMGQTLSDAKKVVQDPVTAAVDSARSSLTLDGSAPKGQEAETEAQEDADSIAEEPKLKAQAMGEESQAEAGDVSEELEPDTPETVEQSQTEADVPAERPRPEARAIGDESPAEQQVADEEPAPGLQSAAESEAAEQDHE